jgi:1,4-alpha-glucan branching enzyme
VSYKLVIDGLWTIDPMNPSTIYDRTAGRLSTVRIPQRAAPATNTRHGTARFIYYGESNKRVRLTGSFANWDPYIYEMRETAAGVYTLDIPLPKGSYYYQFIVGLQEIPDPLNIRRVHSPDGRSASVLQVD